MRLLFSFFLHYYIFYVIILVNISGASVYVRIMRVWTPDLASFRLLPFCAATVLHLPLFENAFIYFCFCTVGLTTKRQRHGKMHIHFKRKDKKTWHIPTKSHKSGKR